MKKFKLFTDATKEEAWLNEWMRLGYEVTRKNMFQVYSFTRTADTNRAIRIDCQSFSSKKAFEHYKQFHEELGWHYIDGSQWQHLHYWRSPTSREDELFSDHDSEKLYLQRLTQYYSLYTTFFFVLAIIFVDDMSNFFNIQSAFLTPGLWNKEGSAFISAFLFELPFALVRFFSPWFMVVAGFFFLRTYMNYTKHLKKHRS